MAGDVTLEKYAPVTDSSGKTIAYDATITR
jgi:hypothetical protein